MIDEITRRAIDQAARAAAEDVFNRMLVRMGLDPTSPIEIQHDMAALRSMRDLISDREFQEDVAYLRNLRAVTESVHKHGLLVMVGVVLTGMFAMVWIGVKQMLQG